MATGPAIGLLLRVIVAPASVTIFNPPLKCIQFFQ
jgi:hypothetical protein